MKTSLLNFINADVRRVAAVTTSAICSGFFPPQLHLKGLKQCSSTSTVAQITFSRNSVAHYLVKHRPCFYTHKQTHIILKQRICSCMHCSENLAG